MGGAHPGARGRRLCDALGLAQDQGIVEYAINQSLTASGFDLIAGCGFDVNMCLGYPTMRAYVRAYEGTGYYTASAWIQIVTRREFVSVEADAPSAIVSSVDVNLEGKRQVEIHPLVTTGIPRWQRHLPLLRSECANWAFAE